MYQSEFNKFDEAIRSLWENIVSYRLHDVVSVTESNITDFRVEQDMEGRIGFSDAQVLIGGKEYLLYTRPDSETLYSLFMYISEDHTIEILDSDGILKLEFMQFVIQDGDSK